MTHEESPKTPKTHCAGIALKDYKVKSLWKDLKRPHWVKRVGWNIKNYLRKKKTEAECLVNERIFCTEKVVWTSLNKISCSWFSSSQVLLYSSQSSLQQFLTEICIGTSGRKYSEEKGWYNIVIGRIQGIIAPQFKFSNSKPQSSLVRQLLPSSSLIFHLEAAVNDSSIESI